MGGYVRGVDQRFKMEGADDANTRCCTFPATRTLTLTARRRLQRYGLKCETGCILSATEGIYFKSVSLGDLCSVACGTTQGRLLKLCKINRGMTSYVYLFKLRRLSTFPMSARVHRTLSTRCGQKFPGEHCGNYQNIVRRCVFCCRLVGWRFDEWQ